jgi:hypothetical protein
VNWFEPTDEQRAAWSEFLATRPPHVRDVASRFAPWTLYKLITTGQRCSVLGFHEIDDEESAKIAADGCGVSSAPVAVCIHAENPTLGILTARNVFGIDPATLIEWTEANEPASRMPSAFDPEGD